MLWTKSGQILPGSIYANKFSAMSLDPQYVNEFLSSTQGAGSMQFGPELMASFYKNEQGRFISSRDDKDITDVYQNFLGYMDSRNKSAATHNEYIKAFQDKPGRSATLLTGLAANAEQKILGLGSNPNKSAILGG